MLPYDARWLVALLLSCFALSIFSKPSPLPRPYRSGDVVVDGSKLYVDGNEFIVKGMVYNPVPLGFRTVDADGWNGGGYCSAKKNSWSEFKSACSDSDFFDGSDGGLDRVPPGPATWFKALWDRDFPKMRDLGVNTLRLYNVNPTTLMASQALLSSGWNGIKEPRGKDHRPFMDAAYASGFKVMFPLLGDETLLMTDSKEMAEQKLKNLIDEVGGHPALLMWVFGNELDFASPSKQQLRTLMNEKMDFVRQYTMQKWNRVIPVTSCVIDIPPIYDALAATLNVDVFCPNAGYRGGSLTDLFSGNATQRFSGFSAISQQSGMPILIGEMGFLSINDSINSKDPTWFNRLWKDVLDHVKDGSIGGVFFEFNDEIYKRNAPPDQINLGVVKFEPATDGASGLSSLEENVFTADAVVEKPVIYAAMKNGTLNGLSINYNTDVFQYLGRPADKLRVSPAPVPKANSSSLISCALYWMVQVCIASSMYLLMK